LNNILGLQQNKETFYPQLDSLRAIAVILVIVSHWFAPNHLLNRYTANGILGVTLFFVLSGFLITGILLRSRESIDAGRLAPKKAFGVFYARRALRIFPVYYVLLLIVVIFNFALIGDSFWWHFSYTSNFYFWIKEAWDGPLSHLWSLSVEEQFYIAWPMLIFFIPNRLFPALFFAGIFIAVVFRHFIITDHSDFGRLLMPGSLDSFCIGGLLAYARHKSAAVYKYYLTSRNTYVIIAFLLLLAVHLPFMKKLPANISLNIYLLFISVAFGIIIDRVADTVTTPMLGTALSNKALLYTGKISYGIYLYHNFIHQIYGLPEFPGSFYVEKVVRFFLLLLLATTSWYVLEKPMLRLKDRFIIKSSYE
jgi:peptidoglycan/LPS O-acetylase OafA/YrhL